MLASSSGAPDESSTMPRATLAAATAAFTALYTALHAAATAHPPAPAHTIFSSLAEVQHLLDLFAHIERVDDKLIRSARRMSAAQGQGEETGWGKYVRAGEARRERRMVYIGWSMMLRRSYLNSLLICAVEANDVTASLPRLAPLQQQIHALYPPCADDEYAHAKRLFIRNTDDREKKYVRRTLDKYQEVITLFDRGDGWHPDLLPRAKHIAEALQGMNNYVLTVTRVHSALQKLVPRSNQASSSSAMAATRHREETPPTPMTAFEEQRRRARSASLRPSMDPFIRVRTRAPSFAPLPDTSSSTVIGGKRARMSLPARLHSINPDHPARQSVQDGKDDHDQERKEKRTSKASRAVLDFFGGPPDGGTSTRMGMGLSTGGTVVFGNDEGGMKVEQEEDGIRGLNGQDEEGFLRDVVSSAAEHRVRSLKEEEITTPQRSSTTHHAHVPSAANDANHAVTEPIHTPAAAKIESPGPASEARAPVRVREGSVLVPSPGMRFEIDGQGRLVYVGGGDFGIVAPISTRTPPPLGTAATQSTTRMMETTTMRTLTETETKVTTPLNETMTTPTAATTMTTTTSGRPSLMTPQSLAASREKVAKAAKATRSPVSVGRTRASFGATSGPAGTRSVGSADVGGSGSGAGAGGAAGEDMKKADTVTAVFATPVVPSEKRLGKRRYTESMASVVPLAGRRDDDPDEEEDEGAGRGKRQRVSTGGMHQPDSSHAAMSARNDPSANQTHHQQQQMPTTRVLTRSPITGKPAPFDDSEVERLPVSSRRRGVRRASGTAVAFSLAMREASAKPSGGSGSTRG